MVGNHGQGKTSRAIVVVREYRCPTGQEQEAIIQALLNLLGSGQRSGWHVNLEGNVCKCKGEEEVPRKSQDAGTA